MREAVAGVDLVTLDDLYFMYENMGAEFVIEHGTITEIIRNL